MTPEEELLERIREKGFVLDIFKTVTERQAAELLGCSLYTLQERRRNSPDPRKFAQRRSAHDFRYTAEQLLKLSDTW